MAAFRDPESREWVFDLPGRPSIRARFLRLRAEIEQSARRFYQTWVLFGLVLLVIGGVAQLGVVLALALLVLLSAVVSRLWAALALQRVQYDRLFSQRRVFWGETVDVTLRLTNYKPLPLPWVRFDDEVPAGIWNGAEPPEPTADAGRGLINRTTSLAWYERVGWRFRIQCTERGYHRFGPVRLRSSDIFGLFPVYARLDVIDHLLVYPRLVTLDDLKLPISRPFGPVRGAAPIYEDPVRFRGLRDYQPTDQLRDIDWKATARLGELQVRSYESTAVDHWLVLLNLRTIPHPYQGYVPYLLERAVSVAATLAVEGYARKAAVGLLSNSSLFNSDLPIRIRPGRDPQQLHRILEALAMAHFLSPFSLDNLLQQEARHLPFATTLVLVTALFEERLLQTLHHLHRQGHPALVFYVGDNEVAPEVYGIPVRALGPKLAEQGLEAA